MATRAELVVCGCCDEDLAVLRAALGTGGPVLQVVDNPVQAVHRIMARPPMAIVLGLGRTSLSNLDLIPVIVAAGRDLRVIVIAEEDSLELEKAARQKGIFYYLVHPLEVDEVRALMGALLQEPRRGKLS